MPDRKKRAERRAQHIAEVEESQARMRTSIAETERLMGESEEMLRRHRKENDDDEAEDQDAAANATPG